MNKKLVALMCAAVTAASVPVCSFAEETKEPVTLSWWYFGNGEQKDTKAVNDYLNEQLKSYEGLEHVTIDLHPLDQNNFATLLTLGFSAGEKIDIVNTCFAYTLDNLYEDGALMPMDDYLELVPDLTATLPEWLMTYGKIDGKTYMIPNYQMARMGRYWAIPAEHIEKGYITQEEFEKMSVDTTPVAERFDLVEKYIKAVREEEPDAVIYDSFMEHLIDVQTLHLDELSNMFVVESGTTEVTYLPLKEDIKTAFEYIARWYEEGLLQEEAERDHEPGWVVSDGVFNAYPFGQQTIYLTDNEQLTKNVNERYGVDAVCMPVADKIFSGYSWAAGGNSITVNCEHPEEAMLFIEAMCTEKGKELYNTVVYGLEGTHWEWVDKEESKIKTLEYDTSQSDASTSYGAMKWICGNTFNAYLNQACSKEENDATLIANGEAVASELAGLVLDKTPVQTQLDQISAIWGEYEDILFHGLAEAEWENQYNDMAAKLEAAGMNDVIAEFQKQVDAFLAAK